MRDSYRSIFPTNMSFRASCRPQRFLDAVEVMGKDSEGKGRSEGHFAVFLGWLRWESTRFPSWIPKMIRMMVLKKIVSINHAPHFPVYEVLGLQLCSFFYVTIDETWSFVLRIVYMFLLGSSALDHDRFPVQAQAHKFHTFGVDIHSFLSNADLQEFDKMHGVCTVHVCTSFLYPPQLGARLIDDRGVLSTSLHLKTILNTKF